MTSCDAPLFNAKRTLSLAKTGVVIEAWIALSGVHLKVRGPFVLLFIL